MSTAVTTVVPLRDITASSSAINAQIAFGHHFIDRRLDPLVELRPMLLTLTGIALISCVPGAFIYQYTGKAGMGFGVLVVVSILLTQLREPFVNLWYNTTLHREVERIFDTEFGRVPAEVFKFVLTQDVGKRWAAKESPECMEALNYLLDDGTKLNVREVVDTARLIGSSS